MSEIIRLEQLHQPRAPLPAFPAPPSASTTQSLCVEKLCLMDIAPTLTMYRDTNKEFATRYVWWSFQIQPFPLPEHMIGLDPEYYLREHLAVQGKTPGAVSPQAMAEYLRCYCCSGTIHAACEELRKFFRNSLQS